MNTESERPNTAPIVKSFQIKGLHGYKNVRLDFTHSVKIVIAENGAGKTTILSALEAFLRADFGKLATLQFDTIECELSGVNEKLVLKQENISAADENLAPLLNELAAFADVEASELRQVISDFTEAGKPINVLNHPLFERIYQQSPYDTEEVIEKLLAVRIALDRSYSEDVKALIAVLRSRLKDYDILYLPTFRRIERPLVGKGGIRRRRFSYPGRNMAAHPVNDGIARGSKLRSDINYGLSDVEDRLVEIMESIQRRSNNGYRQISAAIIDDLIAGKFGSNPSLTKSLPSIDALRLFFSRIQQSSPDSESRLTAITKLYESPPTASNEDSPLRYFLAMLASVVDQTKELEADIEQFVEKVNTYLRESSDEKLLLYDAVRMKVLVQNTWTNANVKLDDLSSGEKQVISLLAHIYLYSRKKIILIDEPELSLSMDWQKRLLPDVAASSRCSQLLAITHSPFIFDNVLDPYAGPLSIERIRPSAATNTG